MKPEFIQFKETFPDWETQFEVKKKRGKSATYGRIICRWDEVQGIRTLHHRYALVVNSKNGDIYLDCRKRKIYAKNICLMLARPIHSVVKTAWHASCIPAVKELCRYSRKKKNGKECLKRSAQSMADIVWTPLYGAAMTTTQLAGLVIPKIGYASRKVTGKLDLSLNRVRDERDSPWVLAPCFCPLENMATIHRQAKPKKYQNTVEQTPENIKEGLSVFAKKQIRFLRRTPNPFNDCFHLVAYDEEFTSKALKKKEDEESSPSKV